MSSPLPPPDRSARLETEARFQDARVRAGAGEPRERFYYLAAPAFARYRRALDSLAGREVLVVGCSEGGVTPLARAGSRVTGVDISPAAVASLAASIRREGLSDRARALVMDAEDLTLPTSSFDAIVLTGVLHHLDVDAACRSFRRVLRPGGRILMLEPMALGPGAALYRALTPDQRTPDEHPLLPRDLATLRRHFRLVRFEGFGLLTLLSIPLLALPRAAPVRRGLHHLLSGLDRIVLAAAPLLRYACWTCYVECERRSRPISTSTSDSNPSGRPARRQSARVTPT